MGCGGRLATNQLRTTQTYSSLVAAIGKRTKELLTFILDPWRETGRPGWDDTVAGEALRVVGEDGSTSGAVGVLAGGETHSTFRISTRRYEDPQVLPALRAVAGDRRFQRLVDCLGWSRPFLQNGSRAGPLLGRADEGGSSPVRSGTATNTC